VLRGANDPAAAHYVLVWSLSQGPFRYDATSDLSLLMINGPVFANWFSLIDDANIHRAQTTLPRLTTLVAGTVWTHGVFFDAQYRITGWVPRSIENRLVP
jgi:hypothetical protein